MQTWTRWQAWVAVVAGACAALSPFFIQTNDNATWTMVVLGVVTAAIALGSMAMAEDRVSEYALMIVGVLFIVSPWVMGFDHLDDMALMAWVVGAVTLVAGVLELPQLENRMHTRHGPIAH